MKRAIAVAAALWTLAGCGLPVGPCATITDVCSCRARADCQPVTEACWCPSECGEKVACVCGGGKFLRCEAKK